MYATVAYFVPRAADRVLLRKALGIERAVHADRRQGRKVPVPNRGDRQDQPPISPPLTSSPAATIAGTARSMVKDPGRCRHSEQTKRIARWRKAWSRVTLFSMRAYCRQGARSANSTRRWIRRESGFDAASRITPSAARRCWHVTNGKRVRVAVFAEGAKAEGHVPPGRYVCLRTCPASIGQSLDGRSPRL